MVHKIEGEKSAKEEEKEAEEEEKKEEEEEETHWGLIMVHLAKENNPCFTSLKGA